MNDLYECFTETDLLFLIDVLSPGASDRQRMIRVLREDEEILRAMITDERLFSRIATDVESHLRISPRLFFAVLLERVRRDVKGHGYTLEKASQHQAVVFDSAEVLALLDTPGVLEYLVELLVSFVRIQSYSVTVRMPQGVWRRYRFSDFDVDNLIRYAAALEEQQRFPSYKRIADVCLFLTGVFPEAVEGRRLHLGASFSERRRSRESYEARGRYFYRAAAGLRAAQLAGIDEVMLRLSEKFDLATKPLSHMSGRYLGGLKETLFSE